MTARLFPIACATLIAAAMVAGCGSTPRQTTETTTSTKQRTDERRTARAEDDFPSEPPASEAPRDISFPPIGRAKTAQKLEVNTVEWDQLPVVYLRLVIESGGEVDPEDAPGLSKLVAAMLEEGTESRTSAELAEEVEFIGADLRTASDEENIYIVMRALSTHLDQAVEILADVAMNPAFRAKELKKLKKRQKNRLSLQANDPAFLAKRAMHQTLYGEHPYANVDTTKEVVDDVRRIDLMRWHRRWFKPNNAFLVAVGDTESSRVESLVGEHFEGWEPGRLPEREYGELPTRDKRQVVVVDRPESVQSVIRIANLAIPRDHDQWIPLQVANQVLGGSPASRLFMDLRERRSLTYGAYSSVGERVKTAPFMASASVQSAKTGAAIGAFFEHLNAITEQAPPKPELADAKRYLSDSFPLKIDTPGKIASLVGDLRIFDLPDDYWDNYRSRIGEVTADQALQAARDHVHPDDALIVVVGRAADVVEPLRQWGPVRVVNTEGETLQTFEPKTAEADGSEGEKPKQQ